MNKIQKIQQVFHTDKWWGKIFLFITFYTIYFTIGYWVWFLIGILEIFNIFILENILPSLYFFIFLPILSFILIFKIRKKFNIKINKVALFFINLVIVLINVSLFVFIGIYLFMKPEMFI